MLSARTSEPNVEKANSTGFVLMTKFNHPRTRDFSDAVSLRADSKASWNSARSIVVRCSSAAENSALRLRGPAVTSFKGEVEIDG